MTWGQSWKEGRGDSWRGGQFLTPSMTIVSDVFTHHKTQILNTWNLLCTRFTSIKTKRQVPKQVPGVTQTRNPRTQEVETGLRLKASLGYIMLNYLKRNKSTTSNTEPCRLQMLCNPRGTAASLSLDKLTSC